MFSLWTLASRAGLTGLLITFTAPGTNSLVTLSHAREAKSKMALEISSFSSKAQRSLVEPMYAFAPQQALSPASLEVRLLASAGTPALGQICWASS